MRKNTVKEILRSGQPSIGVWLNLGSPMVAEVMAHCGYDWLVIDTEHGAADMSNALPLLQAISTTDTIPMMRVPWNEPYLVKRALDIGAYGIVAPMVNNRADAERLVGSCKFPPVGFRSLSAGRGSLYGGPDYLARANDEIAVIVQLEHVEAVRNAEEILSVPGIDAFYIGPNDLCASLGLEPSYDNPNSAFTDALQTLLDAGRKTGVPGGIHTGNAEQAIRRIAQGFKFVAVGADRNFVEGAALAAMKQVRAAMAASAPA